MSDIRSILSSYKQRFISTNSRSRNYFLTNLHPKHSVDLVTINQLFGNDQDLMTSLNQKTKLSFLKTTPSYDEVKTALWSENFKEAKLKMPYIDQKEFQAFITLKDDFHRCEEACEYINQEDLEDDELSEEYKTSLKELKTAQDALNGKIKVIFDSNVKKIEREFAAFEKILTGHKNILKDYGKNDLYLGYPFIEGRFASDKLFRAPLVLHRVNLTVNKSKIELSFEENESILNPVFLIAFYLENELEHKKFQWSLDSFDFVDEALKILENNGITCSVSEFVARPFESMTKRIYSEQQVHGFNQFSLVHNSVLGLFPISDRNIYNDLEELESFEFEEEDSVSKFIHSTESIDDYLDTDEKQRAHEDEIKYITDLDYSQKNVVKEALSHNLVIEGPPGTGKSQVLSNIVANLISQGKRVLLVSEKVAAIEVVYNRLGKLSTHALIIKNHITDKQHFYQQLKNVIEAIRNGSATDIYPEFVELNNLIESRLSKLEKRDELHHFVQEGFSLKDLLKIHKSQVHKNENLDLTIFDEIKAIKSGELKDELVHLETEVKLIFESGLMDWMTLHFPYLDEELKADISLLTALVRYTSDVTLNSQDAEKVLLQKHLLGLKRDSHITEDFSKSILKSFDEVKAAIVSHQETHLIEHYKEHKKESEHPVYKYLGTSPAVVAFLKKWKKLSTKHRVMGLQQLLGTERKKPFLTFDYLKMLTSEENEIYHTIDSSLSSLKFQRLIPYSLNDETTALLDHMLNFSEIDPVQIAYDAFAKGIFKVDFSRLRLNVESMLNLKKKSTINAKLTQSHINDIHVLTALKLAQCAITQEEEAIQVLSRVITQELFDVIKDDIEFYENYEENYTKMSEAFEQKIEKSRLSILEDVLKLIRLKLSSESARQEFGELKRLSELQRLRSVPEVTKRFTDTLLTLFPICLMTPASVSATLENKKDLFDVVIFDEASQMFTEHAVPSIHRSKRLVVAGDSQQLRPSSIFQSRFAESDDYEDDNDDFNSIAALQSESLLDQSRNKFKSVYLSYHYRSEHKELIDFSNHAFYGARLIFSSQVTNIDPMPIEMIEVEGRWSDQKNPLEAQKVLELVKDILLARKSNESIGIITFNSKQMDLIQDLIDEEATINKELSDELHRVNPTTEADESLFVKNIENVQGDERDIIIFSVAYGHNEKGQLINQFGSLSQPTGENRLNVAITRAKKKIYFIKSIKADDLRPNIENRGNFYFKKYLQYVEKLNAYQPLDEFLFQLADNIQKNHQIENFDSPFEVEVFNALKESIKDPRYEIRNQVRVGSFRIDIAIYDKTSEQFVLGIECDGAAYHSKPSAVEHDYYRQRYLESRGWRIHRIWSTNWWTNMEKETTYIIEKLSS